MKKKEKRAQLIFFLKRVHFFITYLLKEAKEICKKNHSRNKDFDQIKFHVSIIYFQ